MKTTKTMRFLLFLLAMAMILPLAASCKKESNTATESNALTTQAAPSDEPSSLEEPASSEAPSSSEEPSSTEEPSSSEEIPPVPEDDPPVVEVPSQASVYTGTPDTSWYTGDKSEYLLTSADQLVGMMELRSATFNFENITLKLDCDMVINQGTLEEIKARGAENHNWKDLHSKWSFQGVFDGQGHTISGLYMQLGGAAISSMFGSAAGNAEIKNFNLLNSYFGTPNQISESKMILAGIVSRVIAENSNVTISNVNVHADILDAKTEYPFSRAAGIVGVVSGKNISVTIKNCSFNGTISITGNYAGGMIAAVEDKTSNVTLSACANYGTISAAQYCGGLMGLCQSQNVKMISSVNYGTLNCEANCGDLVGEQLVLNDPYQGARPTAPEGTTALRVMSFNIQSKLQTNGSFITGAENRIKAVNQEILYYSPDLLGLQEDSGTWLDVLKLNDYNLIQDSTNGTSANGERCAIYYKKGMNLLASGTEWLTSTRTGGSVTGLTYAELTDPNGKFYMTPEELEILEIKSDSDLKSRKTTYVDQKTGERKTYADGYTIMDTRKFTYGVFEVNGQHIIYINTHLQHRSQNAIYSNDAFQKIRSLERIKEFDLLKESIAEIEKEYPDSLIFMTGDWNNGKGSEIFNAVYDAGYRSAESITPEHIGPKGSWNNAFDLDAQGDSYPANEGKEGTTTGYLDFCFVEEGIDVIRFTVGAGKSEITLSNGSKKTIYTSDHLPIITDLCFKTEITGDFINPGTPGGSTEDLTKPSVYNNLPDTSWFDKDNPKTEYTLTTAAQFAGMMKLRQDSKGAITFEGITIKLARDLIINEGTVSEYLQKSAIYEIQPLNSKYSFKGTFDGLGHTISGVYINCPSSGARGLFGGLGNNATIKNLIITEAYFDGTDGSDGDKNTGGILAARANGTNITISNVTISNALMKEDKGNFCGAGLLIGKVDSSKSITIENCSTSGTIEFEEKGLEHFGGLIGFVQGSASVTIKNTSSSAKITAINNIGGFIGNADSTATITIYNNCSFTGTLTCTTTDTAVTGTYIANLPDYTPVVP